MSVSKIFGIGEFKNIKWLDESNRHLSQLDTTLLCYNSSPQNNGNNYKHTTSCVRTEHSTYFTAPISFIISKPCSYVIGAIFTCCSFSMVAL